VTGSVLEENLVYRLARRADVIYHLAAAVGTLTIRDHWRHSLEVNLEGTRNVTTAAARYGAVLLFTSTSEIYGTTPGSLQEDALRTLGSPLRPRWAYAEAKAADESMISAYARDHGLRAVIVRPFNIAGPWQSAEFGMVIPRFVQQALAGESLTVHGDGSQRRSFCHVADVVPALATLPLVPEAYGRAVNIGASEQVSVGHLAIRVLELAGGTGKVTYQPLEDVMGADWDDMQRGVPDCTAVRELAGFQVTRSLDDIIRDVIVSQGGKPCHLTGGG
jgi:UDP-glucose 4-epimerase